MKWWPTNFSESLYPLTITYSVLGHGVFRFPPKRRHPKFSVIYAIVVTILYYLLLGFTLNFSYNAPWFNKGAYRFYAISYVHLVIGVIAQGLSWYHQKSVAGYVKDLMKVDDTLQELGATIDYTGEMMTGIKRLCLWICCCFILNGVDVVWLLAYVPLKEIMVVVSVLHYPIHVNSIIAVHFSVMVSQVGLRFRKTNELLEKVMKPGRKQINNQAWRYYRTKVSPKSFTISTTKMLHCTDYKKHFIQIIKHVHLELRLIALNFNRLFGIKLVLEISGYFILVTCLLYDIFTVVIDPKAPRRYLRGFGQVVWCSTFLIKLIIMNRECERTVAEAHRTGDILHFIENALDDPELNDEVKHFTFQMAQYPLLFSPLGLITLGWQFVRGFFATVTTYLIIMIQNDED